MKIAVEIHGSMTHGLFSPERGESRWAQNVAAVLGTLGHEVIGFGDGLGENGGWGACPRMPGVRLVHWREVDGLDCDVLVDMAWWQGKTTRVKARNVLRGYYGFDHNLRDPAPEGHLFVFPYPPSYRQVNVPENPNRDRCFFLGCPLPPLDWWRTHALAWPDDLRPARSRPFVVCPSRNIFGEGDAPDDRPIIHYADRMLDLAAALARDAGLIPVFIGAHYYERGYGREVRERRVAERIDELRTRHGAIILGSTPYGYVLHHFERARVVLNAPVWGAVAMEAAIARAPPIPWSDQPFFREAGDRCGLTVPADEFKPEALDATLDVLLHNDGRRAGFLNNLHAELYPAVSVETFVWQWKILEERLR